MCEFGGWAGVCLFVKLWRVLRDGTRADLFPTPSTPSIPLTLLALPAPLTSLTPPIFSSHWGSGCRFLGLFQTFPVPPVSAFVPLPADFRAFRNLRSLRFLVTFGTIGFLWSFGTLRTFRIFGTLKILRILGSLGSLGSFGLLDRFCCVPFFRPLVFTVCRDLSGTPFFNWRRMKRGGRRRRSIPVGIAVRQDLRLLSVQFPLFLAGRSLDDSAA